MSREEKINKLKDRFVEIIESEEQKEKELRQMNRASETYGIPQVYQAMHYGNPRRRGERERIFEEI